MGQRNGAVLAFIVPEPVADARVLAVIPCSPGDAFYGHVQLLEITKVPRQFFGGFAVLALEMALDRAQTVGKTLVKVQPLGSIAANVAT